LRESLFQLYTHWTPKTDTSSTWATKCGLWNSPLSLVYSFYLSYYLWSHFHDITYQHQLVSLPYLLPDSYSRLRACNLPPLSWVSSSKPPSNDSSSSLETSARLCD
jgi:hypothetical protein